MSKTRSKSNPPLPQTTSPLLGGWKLHMSRTLTLLTTVWLTLATTLVYKHPDLIAVFAGFVTCFALAGSWMLFKLVATHRISPLLGMATTALALSFLMTTTNSSTTFLSLAMATGYLAYDHWWVGFICQAKPLTLVVEDAITLTVFIVALATQPVEDYRTSIELWLLYKTVRLIHQLATQSKHTSNSKLAMGKNLLSDAAMAQVGPPQNYWIIHGQSYDLNLFLDRHPGGKEALMLGQGRDCTALFESYHPFTCAHKQILQKYHVTELGKQLTVRRPQRHDAFYALLCQRVEQQLLEHDINPITDRAATPGRWLYYGIILVALVATGRAHVKGSIVGSFLFAVFGWLIGSLGHDAGHFSASRIPWINTCGVWAMSLLCNPVMWQHQHTYAHHSHTNQFEHDPDLHHFDSLLRVHRRIKQQGIYKYQSNMLFVMFAYALVVFGTCFWIPWSVMTEGTLHGIVEWSDRHRPWKAVGMVLHMLGYAAFIMVLPFAVHDSWWSALIAVLAHISTSGLLFALFSQINHLNESSIEIREHSQESILKDSWAVAQIETSNNFATDSLVWHVLSNGLNLQIEHHLFPGLNHCHLHAITPIVQQTCEEYGVLYKNYKTWNDVFAATLDWLERLSNEPEPETPTSCKAI